jgi:MFS family permease
VPGSQLGATLRVLRAVLRSPSLRRVMGAFLLFAALEFGTWVAILLYAYDELGPQAVGLVAVVQLVPSAAFAAIATSSADRFARNRVLLAGYLLQAVTLGLTAVGMLAGWPPIAVIAAAVAASSAMTIARPAHWALLPMLARTPEELTTANGVSGSAAGAGELLGPLVAAGILALAPPGGVFAAGAIAAAVASLLVTRLPVHGGGHVIHQHAPDDPLAGDEAVVPDGQPEARQPGAWARTASAMRTLGGRGEVRVIVLILAAYAFILGATDVLFVLLSLEVLGIGPSGAAALGAAMGAGSILGGVAAFTLVGRRRLSPVLLVGALVLGGACIVLGLAPRPLVAALIVAIGGIGGTMLDIAGRTILQRVADPRTLTRVLGALEGLGILAMALGSLLAPTIATAASVPVALLVTGLVLPAAVGLAWAPLRGIDRRVRVPVRELALLRFDRILSPLPGPKLEAVASTARWITLEPGEALIREGDPGDRYYVLESGGLRITQAGRVLHENEAERGYGLGEIALLRDVPRTATATATTPSVLLAIARPDFLEAVTGHEQAGAAAEDTAATREPVPDPA